MRTRKYDWKNVTHLRYMVALVVFAVTAACVAFLHWQVEYTSTALFLVAIMFIAWRAGRGPALMVTILSSAFTLYILIDPVFSWGLGINEAVRIFVFVAAALIISSLTTRTQNAENEVRDLNAALEKRVEERTAELHEANYKLKAFSYTVAHDLRAPLRAIQGFAEALKTDYGSTLEETAEDYLERMGRSAARMDQLISDLIKHTELTSREVQLVPVDLDRCLKHVLTELEHIIVRSGGFVSVKGTLGMVMGATKNIELVLRHLIQNALQFVEAGKKPELEVWSEVSHDGVRVYFKDNGVGIAPEYHERIFGVFQTLGPSEKSSTGIGLPTVKAAMLQMSGNVGLKSHVAEGSLFWLQFQPLPANAFLGRDAASPENGVSKDTGPARKKTATPSFGGW